MSKDYFEGRSAYVPPPINHRPWWLDALLGLACFLTAAVIIASFAGCTTTREAEVCYIKPIGVTEQGFTVAFQQCMSPEAFQKAQE